VIGRELVCPTCDRRWPSWGNVEAAATHIAECAAAAGGRQQPPRRPPSTHRVRVSITQPPEWTPDDLPPDDPRKWARCRRCPHLRIEHTPNGRRCEVLHDAEQPLTRCDCAGFDPTTHRRETP